MDADADDDDGHEDAEGKQRQQELLIATAGAGQGGPGHLGDETPGRAGHRRVGGHDVLAGTAGRPERADPGGEDPLYRVLAGEVRARQPEVAVVDGLPAVVHQVGRSALAESETDDPRIQRTDGGRTHVEHAHRCAEQLSARAEDGYAEGDRQLSIALGAEDVGEDRPVRSDQSEQEGVDLLT